MLWAPHQGGIELRRQPDGSTRLRGRFPYGQTAVLSDGGRTGRPRKERFASRAFGFRVEDETADIHLLLGHDFDHPLASRGTGSLALRDSDEALTFEAIIAAAIVETTHGKDALALIAAGLAVGISPGFRIPPERAVADSEEIEEEPDDGSEDENGQPRRGALIRTVKAALLFELSIVTRPAYQEASVEARSWALTPPQRAERYHRNLPYALGRWRA